MDKIKQRSELALLKLGMWYEFGMIEKQRPPPNYWLFMKTQGLIAYDRTITRTDI